MRDPLPQAYPGDKHACAALLYALPATGVSLERMQGLLRGQLDALADAGPTPAELQRIKKVRNMAPCALHARKLPGRWGFPTLMHCQRALSQCRARLTETV
jgi:anti-sigma factor RsiW